MLTKYAFSGHSIHSNICHSSGFSSNDSESKVKILVEAVAVVKGGVSRGYVKMLIFQC